MRALIFDLDDTLLDRRKTVSTKNRAALLAAADAGYQLVIATSRPIRAIRQFVPAELLSVSITVSLNGAATWFAHGRPPELHGTIGEPLEALLDALEATHDEIHFSVETDGQTFALSQPLDADELWSTHSATPEMVVPLDSLAPHRVTKIAVDGQGRVIEETIRLGDRFPALRFIPSDSHTFVGIVSSAIDKSLTLTTLAEREGLDLASSIAFGDDLPDLNLFSVVGRAVAMGNAVKEIKAAAGETIGDCDSDAIARYLAATVLR